MENDEELEQEPLAPPAPAPAPAKGGEGEDPVLKELKRQSRLLAGLSRRIPRPVAQEHEPAPIASEEPPLTGEEESDPIEMLGREL